MSSSPRQHPVTMEKLVSLCARRGFIYPSSEIYGGFNGFWDYGPLGSEMRNAVKNAWWQRMVRERDDVVGLDTSIIANPQTWVASGHIDVLSMGEPEPVNLALGRGRRLYCRAEPPA